MPQSDPIHAKLDRCSKQSKGATHMPIEWGVKLLDLVLGGLPEIIKILPPHWNKQAAARVRDFNPFAQIAENADLLRALRLAWIEAALEIDKAVSKHLAFPEWHAEAEATNRFSVLLQEDLRRLRGEAFNRLAYPETTAIDAHFHAVLAQLPTYMQRDDSSFSGDLLTRDFIPILAAITGWAKSEIPLLYTQIGTSGVPLPGGASPRPFGELVFAAFAEIIKTPQRYPEATEAFNVSIQVMARELTIATLEGVRGLDHRLDKLLNEIGNIPTQEGLEAYISSINREWVSHWASMEIQVSRVEEKLDASVALQEDQSATLQKILIAVEGKVGAGPKQLAYDTVLALAQRLKPNDFLDFEQAVKELEFAIDVALQVRSQVGNAEVNSDQFVNSVLQRVALATEAGRLDEGAESLDNALTELDHLETMQRDANQKLRTVLQEANLRQGILLRDVKRTTNAVTALAALDAPTRPVASCIFVDRLNAFYQEGIERGVNFSLDVAIDLAEMRNNEAKTSAERGESLMWLGMTQATRGERSSDSTLLDKAVQAYRDALKEYSQERDPLHWAAVQSNLSNALRALGGRESAANRLVDAIHASNEALKVYTQKRTPLEWATTHDSLGNALYALGQRKGDTKQLSMGIRAYREALKVRTQERTPIEWSATLNNLGNAFLAIGQRESDTGFLKDAAQAYRQALIVRTQERMPLQWAATQNNLGVVLQNLGQRERGTESLNEAVQAYRAALTQRTRELVPLEWAMTKNNLGNVLCTLGERQSSTERLDEAVQAYREALKERTRELVPLDWAATQHNLGIALRNLSRQKNSVRLLLEAVHILREALEERTQERVPLEWASTLHNLGDSLQDISKNERGTTLLGEAVQSYRLALKELTQERVPLEWAAIQNNLGVALQTIGQRGGGMESLNEAVQAYQSSLSERTRERVPLQWAATQNNLGNSLCVIFQQEGGTASLESAVTAYRLALLERTRQRSPLDWAATQSNLGNALFSQGQREEGTTSLKEAVQAYQAALTERTRERAPLEWAMTQNNLGNVLRALGEREKSSQRLYSAIEACHEALTERTQERSPLAWAMTQNNLGNALLALGLLENNVARLKEAEHSYIDALKGYTQEHTPSDWAATTRNLAITRESIARQQEN
jgi:hypothetical protein